MTSSNDETSRSPDGDLPEHLVPAGTGGQRELSAEERELWKRHWGGDSEARNALAEKYFALVELNANKIVEIIVGAIEESDFHQAAVVGYLESLDAFSADQQRQQAFEEFTSHKIRDAILEELVSFIRG